MLNNIQVMLSRKKKERNSYRIKKYVASFKYSTTYLTKSELSLKIREKLLVMLAMDCLISTMQDIKFYRNATINSFSR